MLEIGSHPRTPTWKSKVQMHLLEEIDVQHLDRDNIMIEPVRERLNHRALLQKTLEKLGPAAASEDAG